ncbi:MAG: helix-turn-helix transcriptional regulator [Lachnospiraceae bacterium]|nr:helix-turn-helix transcriptional regulator [Lachnospiraceae bacterium]
MSQFGKYLRFILDERKLSISELSRKSGVERTSLQKSITGNRMLPYESVEKLIWSLQLTPAESDKLKYYYDIFFIGEDKYESRKIIRRMLENLSSVYFENPSPISFSCDYHAGEFDFKMEENSLITGSSNVQAMVQSVFERELCCKNPEIELTTPTEMHFLNEYLFYLFKKRGINGKIRHMIAIHRKKTEKSLNLHSIECFSWLLPLCLVSRQQYHPYYYYDTAVTELFTDPFPYFIVTRDCVLCMAADGAKAILLNSREYADFYRKHFKNLSGKAHELVHYSSGLVSTLAEYRKVFHSDNMYVCTHQPCFPGVCSPDEIRARIRSDIPQSRKIAEICVEYLTSIQSVKKYNHAFMREGVIRFMEDGKIDDFPELVEEIPLSDRLELLRRVVEAAEDGERVEARLFNREVFTYPSFLTLSTSLQTGMGIYTTSRYKDGQMPICIHVYEPDISEAFYDFVLSLPESGLICSREETIRFLREVLETYSKKLSQKA